MSTTETTRKKSRGRQKIEMKKMTNERNLQVTFSKRRNGLFKKANDLCILCGAELALIVFSPGGKVYSFGHPSVEAIIQRYLSQAPNQTSDTVTYIEAYQRAHVSELHEHLSHTNNQLEWDKKHGEELKRLENEAQAQFWWACRVEKMDKPHLEKFKAMLGELKERVTSYNAVVANNPPTYQFFDVAGGSANAMIPFHHSPPPIPQAFPQQLFQGPKLEARHSFGFNNMGGYGGLPGFF